MLPNPNLTIDQHVVLLPLLAQAVNRQPNSQIKPKMLNELVSASESDFPQLQEHPEDKLYLSKLSKDNFEFYVEMGFLSKDGRKYFSTQQLIDWFHVYDQNRDEAMSQFVDALAATSFAQAVVNGTFSTTDDILHLIWNTAGLRDPEDEAAIQATHAAHQLLKHHHLIPTLQASQTDYQQHEEPPPSPISEQHQEFDMAGAAQIDPEETTNANILAGVEESNDYGESSNESPDEIFEDTFPGNLADNGEEDVSQNGTDNSSADIEADEDATYSTAQTDVTHQSTSGVYDDTRPGGIDQDELRDRAAEAGYPVEPDNLSSPNVSSENPASSTPIGNDPFSGLTGLGSRPGRRRRNISGKPKSFATVDPEEIASGGSGTKASSTPSPGSVPPQASPANHTQRPDSRDSTDPGASAFTTHEESLSEQQETDAFGNDAFLSVPQGNLRRLANSRKRLRDSTQQPESYKPGGKRPEMRLGGDGTSTPVTRPSSVEGSTRPPSRRLRKRDQETEDTTSNAATKKRDSQRITNPEKKKRTSHSRISDGSIGSRRGRTQRTKGEEHGDESSKQRPMIRIQQDSIEMDVDAMQQLARMSPEDAEQLRRNLNILKDDTQHDDED
jgi:hypothetical protein